MIEMQKIKLTEYVDLYRRGNGRRGDGGTRIHQLHGQKFYDWFDQNFGLHPIGWISNEQEK